MIPALAPVHGYSENVYLPGTRSVLEYVKFLQRRTFDGRSRKDYDIVDEWRRIDERYRALESNQSDGVDAIEVRALPPAMAALLSGPIADPYFNHCFDHLPVSFALVAIDDCMVHQAHIDLDHVMRLRKQLGSQPGAVELFNICMPTSRSDPQTTGFQESGTSFLFQSDSSDLRGFSPQLLSKELADAMPASGPMAGVVALGVGFGPNYLTGIRIGPRILLYNGYHRAYALRSLGVTHLPMAIQVTSRADELQLLEGGDRIAYMETMSRRRRPPLFRDFFDADLSVRILSRRMRREVQVNVSVTTRYVPADLI